MSGCCADEGCTDNKKGDLATVELNDDDDITSEEEI